MKYLLILLISFSAMADCIDQFNVKTEKDVSVIFCSKDDLQVSKKCSKEASCSLIKDIKQKSPDPKVLRMNIVGNPGSRICNSLGWKVHMASAFDESLVCTCLHPSGEYVTCSSLSDFYQNQTKDKK